MMKIILCPILMLMMPNKPKLLYVNLLILYMMMNMNFLFYSDGDMMNSTFKYSLMIMSIMLFMMCSMLDFFFYMNKKHTTMLFMLIILILLFLSKNMLSFFFLFESSLIPIFILIMGWGYQPERYSASLMMMFYTMFASLPLLTMLFMIYTNMHSLAFLMMNLTTMMNLNMLFSTSMILAFLVKFPIYLVHLWLPAAHVEAPVTGSMILAGILLKLGGFGLIRMTFNLNLNPAFLMAMIITLVGAVILSMLCLVHSDMKVVIAYSSIVHMSMVVVGSLPFSKFGAEGSISMMLAHGFVSSAMFLGCYMMYTSSHSRSYFMNKGFSNESSFFWFIWFLLCMFNFAGPFSYNLFSEIFLILTISMLNLKLLIFISMVSFMSAAYCLILFSLTNHGKSNNYKNNMSLNHMFMLTLSYHMWPIIMLPLSASCLYKLSH